jgi:hypothetical protein
MLVAIVILLIVVVAMLWILCGAFGFYLAYEVDKRRVERGLEGFHGSEKHLSIFVIVSGFIALIPAIRDLATEMAKEGDPIMP